MENDCPRCVEGYRVFARLLPCPGHRVEDLLMILVLALVLILAGAALAYRARPQDPGLPERESFPVPQNDY